MEQYNPMVDHPLNFIEFQLCVVCAGDIVHYSPSGVNVCEKCQDLFQKYVVYKTTEKTLCTSYGQCIITPETRESCHFCLVKKCLQVGLLLKERDYSNFRAVCGFSVSVTTVESHGGQHGALVNTSTGAYVPETLPVVRAKEILTTYKEMDENSASEQSCAVCSDVASGFHYGAYVCEGCKGFFKRCLTNHVTHHKCTKNEHCAITPTKRKKCPYCRLKKCLNVGMSKDGSRLGRRPKRARHMEIEDTVEMSLEELQNMFASVASQKIVIPRRVIEALQASKYRQACGRKTTTELTGQHGVFHNCSNGPNATLNLRRDSQRLKHWTTLFNEMKQSAKEKLSKKQQEFYECCINDIIEAHMQTCWHTYDKYTTKKALYNEKMQTRSFLNQENELDKISETDPQQMWHHVVEGMTPVIQSVVKFVKQIPGFRDLKQEDKIALIQGGSYQVILLRFCRLFEADGMFNPEMNFKISRTELPKIQPFGALFVQQQQISDEFNELSLTDHEIGIVSALCIMQPTRPGLKQSNAVQNLQTFYLKCFYQFLSKRRPDGVDRIVTALFDILVKVELLSEAHITCMKTLDLPQLHQEVFRLQN